MTQPLFSPSSVFWRVNRELASGLAGPRAVLMQIAHPLIAAGRREPQPIPGASLGSSLSHLTSGRSHHLRKSGFCPPGHPIHQSETPGGPRCPAITGGSVSPGTPYDANDPALKLWILSTIMDSTLLVYDLFVSPLSNGEREEYYRGVVAMGRLFAIPEHLVPVTYHDFQSYLNSMLKGDVITVGDTAREIADALFSPSVTGTLLYLGSAVGIGLLPERLQREFGLRWSLQREVWLRRMARLSSRRAGTYLRSFAVAQLRQYRNGWFQRLGRNSAQ